MLVAQNVKARKRVPRFDEEEKAMLLSLVREHLPILECKRTDGATNCRKNEVWNLLTSQFNSRTASPNGPRTQDALKVKWKNLKKTAKEALTTEKENYGGTGGGPGKVGKRDPCVDAVMCMIRPQVEPLNNPYDDDCEQTPLQQDDSVIENIFPAEDENCDPENNGDSEDGNTSYQWESTHNGEDPTGADWPDYTPKMLKTPRSAILRESLHLNLPESSTTEELRKLLSDPDPSIHATANKRKRSFLSESNSPEVAQEGRAPDYCDVSVGLKKADQRPKKLENSRAMQRRRPVLKRTEAEALLASKIATLEGLAKQSKEEHAAQLRILHLQELQEAEKLTQEKLKTAILRQQLLKETGQQFGGRAIDPMRRLA